MRPFKHASLRAALQLFEAPSGPVLVDFPEDAPTAVDVSTSLACPVNFASPPEDMSDTDLLRAALQREIAQLRTWYDLRCHHTRPHHRGRESTHTGGDGHLYRRFPRGPGAAESTGRYPHCGALPVRGGRSQVVLLRGPDSAAGAKCCKTARHWRIGSGVRPQQGGCSSPCRRSVSRAKYPGCTSWPAAFSSPAPAVPNPCLPRPRGSLRRRRPQGGE